MPRTGRPRAEIDKQQFEKLCGIMCTESEICDVFDICEDTLNAWCKRTYKKTFSDTYKKLSAKGKASLRRKQFKIAETNAAMAIFLGKNYLGQTDKIETNENSAEPIQVIITPPDNSNDN
jgi:hypothetical protein